MTVGLGLSLTTPDGQVWDCRTGPVRITDAGMQGLGMPDVDFRVISSPAIDGQRLDSWSLKPRTLFLPFRFKDAAAVDPEGVQRSWWRAHQIGKYGTFTVADLTGNTRSLTCRFQDDGSRQIAVDPYVRSDAFGMTYVADDPWWYGPKQSFRYQLNGINPIPLFGSSGFGPDFNITPNFTQGYVAVSNPGDEDAWPDWIIDGPTTAVDILVGTQHTTYNQTLNAGQRLIIHTDPSRQIAYLGSANPNDATALLEDETTLTPVTRTLAAFDFARISAGQVANVLFSVSGAGSVTAAFRPKYRTAF